MRIGIYHVPALAIGYGRYILALISFRWSITLLFVARSRPIMQTLKDL